MTGVWDEARFVVIDTETTGLHATARILSVAVYCLEDGVTAQSWSTLVNPGEYALLGQDLPDVVLLDTRPLVRAAGRVAPCSTRGDLAASFGLTPVAKHVANADALIVGEVTLRCLAAMSDDIDLRDHATPAVPAPEHSASRPAVTAQHAELHDQPLLTKSDRDTGLGGSLALSCPDLHKRIEDGITDPASARAGYRGALAAMNDTALTRYQPGLLATGPHWHQCADADQCDYCRDGKHERCRLTTGTRRLLWPALYAGKGHLVIDSAHAYLTGAAKAPLTSWSWWSKVHTVAPDTADAVAVTVAAALRQAGHSDLARPAVEEVWKADVRTPYLTTTYAAICETGMAASSAVQHPSGAPLPVRQATRGSAGRCGIHVKCLSVSLRHSSSLRGQRLL